MRCLIRYREKIQYGCLIALEGPSGEEALLAFFSGSKMKKIIIQWVRPEEFRGVLEGALPALRLLLLGKGEAPFSDFAFLLDEQPDLFAPGDGSGPRAEPGCTPASGGSPRSAEASAEVRLSTDGGCAPNPGPGGAAAFLVYPDGKKREITRYEASTTNNRMELSAVVAGLEALPPEVPIRLRLDSQYVQKGITEWMPGWKRKGWKTAAGTPVKNRDLWETLDRLVSGRRIVWEWVRGHCGDPENERCDSLVGEARRLRAGQDRWVDD